MSQATRTHWVIIRTEWMSPGQYAEVARCQECDWVDIRSSSTGLRKDAEEHAPGMVHFVQPDGHGCCGWGR